MTIWELYEHMRTILEQSGISEAAPLEARELTAFATGTDRRNTRDWKTVDVTGEQRRTAGEMMVQRLKGRPVAYILGEWDFYGYTFKVTPDVLIPRSDTEVLCDAAIQHAKRLKQPHILDLCCGSGCIGIAIANEVPQASVVGMDISEEALAVTRENAERYHLNKPRYDAKWANARQSGSVVGLYDMIVSNPPYITAQEMDELDPGVKHFEPSLALFGGEDGLDFYRSIAVLCKRYMHHLRPGGRVLVECGWKQASMVMSLFQMAGLERIETIKDFSGIDRVVSAYSPLESYKEELEHGQ